MGSAVDIVLVNWLQIRNLSTMWTHVTAILVPTRHKQQRCYLSKNTKEEGSFLQKRGVAPCTENKIYFPLLLLYVKSGHLQSSELLQLLFLSGGLRLFGFFSHKSLYICLLPCGYLLFSSFLALSCLNLPFAFLQYKFQFFSPSPSLLLKLIFKFMVYFSIEWQELFRHWIYSLFMY